MAATKDTERDFYKTALGVSTGSLEDLKKAYYEQELSTTGSLPDLEKAYWEDVASTTAGAMEDTRYEYLDATYDGSTQDMLKLHYEAGGPVSGALGYSTPMDYATIYDYTTLTDGDL